MNSRNPISAAAGRRIGVAQLALGVAAVWFCVHAAIYAVGMCRLDPTLYRHLEHGLKHLFGWQALGFLITAIVVSTRRPSAIGRALGGYLALSTAVLLAFSQDAVMLGRFGVLLLWTACAVQGMRLAIGWAAGQRYATWGVAMAAVYAALVPICFFLGVLHAITPPIVAVLAVVAASPGAVVWLRTVGAMERKKACRRRLLWPMAATACRVVPARSDLDDSGGRVHRRQHRRNRFRLGSRTRALHAARDRRSWPVAPVRLLVPAATDGGANVRRGDYGGRLAGSGEVVFLAGTGCLGSIGGRGGSVAQRVAATGAVGGRGGA